MQVAYLPLTNGQRTLVDIDVYEKYQHFFWYLTDNGYVVGKLSLKGSREGRHPTVRLHRLVNETPDGMITDHINRNRLDNRRCNLRSVTQSQNMHNTDLRANNTSGATGVRWSGYHRRWLAIITVNYKNIRLGCFTDIKEAQAVVEKAKRLLFEDPSASLDELKIRRRNRETRGTSWVKRVGLWFAYADVGGNRVSLGYHETREQAIAARRNFECQGAVHA